MFGIKNFLLKTNQSGSSDHYKNHVINIAPPGLFLTSRYRRWAAPIVNLCRPFRASTREKDMTMKLVLKGRYMSTVDVIHGVTNQSVNKP